MTYHISNIVYGGVDGIVTTFAVMAGAIGSGLTGTTVSILALASVFSDGFSMGVSSYESVIGGTENPVTKGLTTFTSFVIIGMIPIVCYYMVRDYDYNSQFAVLAIGSLITLFLIGMFKAYASDNKNILESGLKTFTLGGVAGAIAYYVATSLSSLKDKKNVTQL